MFYLQQDNALLSPRGDSRVLLIQDVSFCYGEANTARIGCNLALAARYRFGNVNTTRIALGDEHLIREQTARYVARIGLDSK